MAAGWRPRRPSLSLAAGHLPAWEGAIGSRLTRLAYRVLGVVALGLAVLGAVLPVLPTTVFVLLAAWAFARSSPKLHAALRADRRFGPALRNWEEHGAIPRAAKIAALAGMAISLAVVVAASRSWLATAATAAVMVASAIFVLTRPEPPPQASAAQTPANQ